jgi:hypothetical protein
MFNYAFGISLLLFLASCYAGNFFSLGVFVALFATTYTVIRYTPLAQWLKPNNLASRLMYLAYILAFMAIALAFLGMSSGANPIAVGIFIGFVLLPSICSLLSGVLVLLVQSIRSQYKQRQTDAQAI